MESDDGISFPLYWARVWEFYASSCMCVLDHWHITDCLVMCGSPSACTLHTRFLISWDILSLQYKAKHWHFSHKKWNILSDGSFLFVIWRDQVSEKYSRNELCCGSYSELYPCGVRLLIPNLETSPGFQLTSCHPCNKDAWMCPKFIYLTNGTSPSSLKWG